MTLYEVIASLEGAQAAVSKSLDMVRSLVGSVQPVAETPETPAVVNMLENMAADIVRTAKQEKDAARKRKTYKKKPFIAPEVRSRAAAEGWVARRKKVVKPATPDLPFADAATQVLKAAGRPMESDELETEMRKLGWTTSSQNTRALFSVMLPTVKGVVKTAPRTWAWKNGNGKS